MRKITLKSKITFEQKVYELVKEKIMNLEIKPGEIVTDGKIANLLNVSRTPVRDALRRLEFEGFLISVYGRGWKVYSLFLEDIEQIIDIKISLETKILREAAECNEDSKRASLKKALKEMKKATETSDSDAWRKANTEFHKVILDMCKNKRAARIIANMNQQYYRVVAVLLPIGSTKEHEAIASAVLAGDGDTAEHLMRIHLENVYKTLSYKITNYVLPYAKEGV